MQSRSSSFQTSGLKLDHSKSHNVLLICLIVLNFVTYCAMIFINAASTIPSLGVFNISTSEISKKFTVEITPAGWTFSTWGVIYTWQALWLILNIVTIFKTTDHGRLYKEPPVLTTVFHIIMFLNFGFNTSWLFVWADSQLSASFGVLLGITLTLYAALVITHKNIYDAELQLSREKVYLWLYRIFVNNGLAFYATWVTIATHLNLAIAIQWSWWPTAKNISQTASLVALSVLTLIIVVYFVLDVFVFEKYLRYTYSPYVQMAIAFGGVLSQNHDFSKGTAVFSLCLAIIGPGIMFLVKVILSIYRHKVRSRLSVSE